MLRIAEFILLADRLLLSAVFLLAGATKLVDPVGFRNALRDFGVAPLLARPGLFLLPALELSVAAALIPARIAWWGACGAFALLAGFCIVAGIAMLRGLRPKCHCFGQLYSAPVGWPTLIRNTVLAACAAWLISAGQLHTEPSLWAWFVSLGGIGRRVAIIAGCLASIGFLRIFDRARHENDPVKSQPLASLLAALLPDDDDREVRKQRPTRVRRRRPMPPPKLAAAERYAMGIGLPVGTPAPEFELPGIDGEKRSLQSLLQGGKDVLLIFSSPFCDACAMLASNLPGWMLEIVELPNVVLISRGTPPDNLSKLRGFETGRILLERDLEVSEAYDCSTIPAAVLIGADGLIRSALANGAVAIRQLLSSRATGANSERSVSKSVDQMESGLKRE